MILTHYQDFLERVDELGFMALSTLSHVLPSLSEETPDGSWHTGDPETDPWCWKDRAVEEKRLAYACILGGHKGFVSARMYPLFYAACHPVESTEARWEAGLVSLETWDLWQLFDEGTALDTSDIRREMGVTRKSGGSRIDTALCELQRDFHITVACSRRKVNRHGQPYGWPACVYERVTDWAPADWLRGVENLHPDEARETILESTAIGQHLGRRDLAKMLWGVHAG